MNRPLRLLCVVPTLDAGGGAETHLSRLLAALDARGDYDLTVATFGAPRGPVVPLPAAARQITLSDRPTGGTLLHAYRAVRPLRRLLRERPVDVVFALLEPASLAALAATGRGPASPPIIASVQNMLSHNYSDAHPLSRFVILRGCRRAFPRAQIVTPSQGVADDIRAVVPRAGPATVIHNAVFDPVRDGVRPEPADRISAEPLLVACGRLTQQKAFPDLLEAVARLQHRSARLWILGEGGDRALIERRIAELNLEGRVKLLGFQAQPRRFMAAADLFVLSSLWEGFGNVLVEAMACGTPVVTTDCPSGPAEIVRNEIDGLVVPPADPEAMATAIDRVLGDATLRRRLGASSLARASEFSVEASAAAHDALFRAELPPDGAS